MTRTRSLSNRFSSERRYQMDRDLRKMGEGEPASVHGYHQGGCQCTRHSLALSLLLNSTACNKKAHPHAGKNQNAGTTALAQSAVVRRDSPVGVSYAPGRPFHHVDTHSSPSASTILHLKRFCVIVWIQVMFLKARVTCNVGVNSLNTRCVSPTLKANEPSAMAATKVFVDFGSRLARLLEERETAVRFDDFLKYAKHGKPKPIFTKLQRRRA